MFLIFCVLSCVSGYLLWLDWFPKYPVFSLWRNLSVITWRQTVSPVYFVDSDLTFMKHRHTVVDGTLSSWSPNISSTYKVLLYISIQCFLRYKLFGDLWPSTCIPRCWIRWERTMTPQQMNSSSPHPHPIFSPPFGDHSVCGSLLSLPQTSVYARFLLWSFRGAPSRGLWRHLC